MFGAQALAWLRTHIEFDHAVMVTTFEEYACWVDAHFFGLEDPRALMESHAEVRHLDVLSPRMFASPLVARRQDADAPELAGERFAPLREHLRRFGGWYTGCIMVPSVDDHTSTVVMLCRNERGARFSAAELAALQSFAPHVVEAAAVNRSVWLPRRSGTDKALPVALLDTEGRFVHTTAAFARLFWPTSPPRSAYLPEGTLKALRKGQPCPLPGGKHTLYGEPEKRGGWRLRLRVTSAHAQLSPRERQVATLFASGASYKAIAAEIGVAPATARNHLQNLYAKLGVTSRGELVALLSKP